MVGKHMYPQLERSLGPRNQHQLVWEPSALAQGLPALPKLPSFGTGSQPGCVGRENVHENKNSYPCLSEPGL